MLWKLKPMGMRIPGGPLKNLKKAESKDRYSGSRAACGGSFEMRAETMRGLDL